MTRAWTRTIALLLFLPLGCIISVSDDTDDDPNDGFAGSSGRAGSSGSAGTGGTSGAGGSDAEGGSAGTGGSTPIDVTCDPEVGDDADPCVQCMKQACCEAWIGCDDQSCADEWLDVRECVASEELADADTLGMCISESSAAMDGLVQSNTQALIDCATTAADDAGSETLCSSECLGTDIYFF